MLIKVYLCTVLFDQYSRKYFCDKNVSGQITLFRYANIFRAPTIIGCKRMNAWKSMVCDCKSLCFFCSEHSISILSIEQCLYGRCRNLFSRLYAQLINIYSAKKESFHPFYLPRKIENFTTKHAHIECTCTCNCIKYWNWKCNAKNQYSEKLCASHGLVLRALMQSNKWILNTHVPGVGRAHKKELIRKRALQSTKSTLSLYT